ncbi:hypothetical protein [Singulisphaera sp. PoT]|uniref:hypothetical protein n=1 Tax=Singulisphaera sp. PoT TaxID=3411797 RepID=UPI003BF4EFD2
MGFFAGFASWLSTFRKENVTNQTLPTTEFGGFDSYGRFQARLQRYALYWAMYENSQYDNVHKWAETYLTEYGLYRFTRGIYNPTKRLGDFWGSHLMGGTLDPKAGDGKECPSALPILTSNDALRPAIATLWRDSNLQESKELYCRLGAILGDVVLQIVDDPEAGRVAIRVVHPGTLTWVEDDGWGNVIAYRIEEARLSPDVDPRTISESVSPEIMRNTVKYTEDAYLDKKKGRVVYRTYLNGSPYAWNNVAAEWDVPYPFIPLIVHRHQRTSPNSFWGMAEVHSGHTKIRNCDDVASKLHDQIRKAVEGVWMLAGVQAPAPGGKQPTATMGASTKDSPQQGRQEMKTVYAGIGATATPLIFPLDIQFTSVEIQNSYKSIEDDYPELAFQRIRLSGDASALALREARKPDEAKVITRRSGYDHSLCIAQKYAIAIGGMRGYEGYQGFGLDDLRSGALEHRIGERPVFHLDPMDRLQEDQAFWTAAQAAVTAGVPLSVFLERHGWSDAQIQELNDAKEAEAKALEPAEPVDPESTRTPADPPAGESDPDDVTPGA